MNNTLEELMLKRRSVRKYKEQPVEKEKIDKLLHYAMSAPSAVNRQPWEFYVVTNKDMLQQICDAGRYTKHNSPLKIIVCGNKKRFLPTNLKEYWIQDCSAAIENILLGVVDLGLGACWEGAYPQTVIVENLIKLLEMPEELIPLAVISIGYPDEDKEPMDQYDVNKIHYIE